MMKPCGSRYQAPPFLYWQVNLFVFLICRQYFLIGNTHLCRGVLVRLGHMRLSCVLLLRLLLIVCRFTHKNHWKLNSFLPWWELDHGKGNCFGVHLSFYSNEFQIYLKVVLQFARLLFYVFFLFIILFFIVDLLLKVVNI